MIYSIESVSYNNGVLEFSVEKQDSETLELIDEPMLFSVQGEALEEIKELMLAFVIQESQKQFYQWNF